MISVSDHFSRPKLYPRSILSSKGDGGKTSPHPHFFVFCAGGSKMPVGSWTRCSALRTPSPFGTPSASAPLPWAADRAYSMVMFVTMFAWGWLTSDEIFLCCGQIRRLVGKDYFRVSVGKRTRHDDIHEFFEENSGAEQVFSSAVHDCIIIPANLLGLSEIRLQVVEKKAKVGRALYTKRWNIIWSPPPHVTRTPTPTYTHTLSFSGEGNVCLGRMLLMGKVWCQAPLWPFARLRSFLLRWLALWKCLEMLIITTQTAPCPPPSFPCHSLLHNSSKVFLKRFRMCAKKNWHKRFAPTYRLQLLFF